MDYVIVPASHLQYVSDFSVTTVTESIDAYELIPQIQAKLPNHSLVTCSVRVSPHVEYDSISNEIVNEKQLPTSVHRRYHVDVFPPDTFQNERCMRCLTGIITSLHDRSLNQSEMDTKYDELIYVIHSEMEANCMYKDVTPTLKNAKKRRNKPYWNDKLGQLWADARDNETQYLKSKRNTKDTRDLHCEFQHKRKIFDVALRRAQQQYNNEQGQRIDTLCTDNPREFSNEKDKLGPDRPHSNTSESVKLSDIILQRWNDFHSLYNSPRDTENTQFFDAAIEQLSNEWEREYQDILQRGEASTPMEIFPQAEQIRQTAASLNQTISMQETVTPFQCTLNGKAVGVDDIANKILKVIGLQVCLHELYSACFDVSIVPTKYYQAIIHPILKRGKSPMFSLSYMGISLMSCVCKVFSSILNNRLVLYAEANDVFAEEENGFRKTRSCVNHIFVLTTILRNRKQQGLSTFSAFLDFPKAFDSGSHKAPWHKLLAYWIYGNMLNI